MLQKGTETEPRHDRCLRAFRAAARPPASILGTTGCIATVRLAGAAARTHDGFFFDSQPGYDGDPDPFSEAHRVNPQWPWRPLLRTTIGRWRAIPISDRLGYAEWAG